MTDLTTSNVALSVPLRGSDPGTWDIPMNGNSSALDGFLGGVQTISLTNAPVALTAPTGSITPSAGPTQSQNRVLKFTGTLTANVPVTLPLPGEYTIQNLTVGNYYVTFNAAGAGYIVSTPQGSVMHVFCDGTNVWLVKNQIPGALTFLGGVSAAPSWVNACTVPPYLLCDGTIYNYSSYPALGNLYGASFGGNGITTFGVQDLRGRVPLAYDSTGTRITSGGCGINGAQLGAAQDKQTNTLLTTNLPPYTPSGTVATTISGGYLGGNTILNAAGGNQAFAGNPQAIVASSTFTGAAQGGSSTPVNNVQPSQVAGIWIVAT